MRFLETLITIIKHDKERQTERDKELQKIRGVHLDTHTGLPVHPIETVEPIPLD